MTKVDKGRAAQTGDADHDALAPYFAAARAEMPVIPAVLRDRILHDAAALQPRPAARERAAQPVAVRDLGARFSELIGGWFGAAGLASAALAGIWLGYADPGLIDAFGGPSAAASVDLMADFGDLLLEG
ncbi:MAG: dihydroorotate dehydrogenase [Paracoccaceae bacterium]